jgi:hypothetical protein
VMRGAIAEVEDYARVSVATRSQAALAGSAVADVIHLLAELIENATTLSPPYTSVRVSGDTVANGFAIEVEDRGLGMSPQRLAELNERLASPPEFNPSDSEQLGLFVVSQLANRHGIRVTLKASPYGGTAAIVLIPGHLVVTEEAFRAGLPGEPTAIGVGAAAGAGAAMRVTNGNHAATGLAGPAGFARGPQLDGPGLPEIPGVRISGAAPQGVAPGSEPANDAAGHPDFDVFMPVRREDGPPASAADAPAADAAAASFSSSSPYQGSAPYAGAGSAPYADQPAPFPGWTGRSAAGGPPAPAASGAGAQAGPVTPMTPVASPRPGRLAGPPWELSRQTGPLPAIPAEGGRGAPPDGPGPDGDVNGLPRRVRQANLAPQLRDNPPRRTTEPAASAASAGGPTPAEIRQTMSALQRGWQEGRSQRTIPAPDGPSPGPAPGALPSPGPSPGGDRGAAADEPPGESDGT